MTRRMTLLSSVLVLTIFQITQATADEMPAETRKALARFVGEWTLEFKIGDVNLKGDATVKWSDNKMSLVLNSKLTDSVSGKEISSTEIFGWDGAREVVVEQGFTSDGSSISATHPASDDAEWTSLAHGWRIVEGKPTYGESVRNFKWKSADELTIEIKVIAPVAERSYDSKCVFRRK